MRSRICLVIALMTLTAFGWLRSYEVLPTQAAWSGWTSAAPGSWVGNTLVANFDSITEISLFCGVRGDTSAHYNVDVYDAQTNDLIAYRHYVAPPGDHSWLRFTSITNVSKFVRGREYVAKFTRPGDSINWYKSAQNNYVYGHMVRGGTGLGQPPGNNDDLCARIYGKARVGDEFSVQSVVAWPNDQDNPKDTSTWAALVESEVDLGVRSDKIGYGFGAWLNPASKTYNWDMMDSLVGLFADAGISTPIQIAPGPWAGCAYSGWRGGIARRLFEPLKVSGQINDSNLAGRFFYDFTKRYGPHGDFWQTHSPYQPITLFETGSEPDQSAIARAGDSTWNGYFQSWNMRFQQYADTIDKYVGLYGEIEGRKRAFLCVYARYVVVMDSAIKLAAQDNGTPDESLPRSACYIISMPAQDPEHIWGEHYMPGEWLQGLKDFGAGDHFDVASYHPYKGSVEDAASWLVDTLRHYFKPQGLLSPRPFWCSEAGHFSYTIDPGEYEQSWPLKLIETYATTQHLNAMPAYPVEQWTWFTYTERYMADYQTGGNPDYWVKQSITDSEFLPRAAGNSYKQWSDLCQGASFEGRIPPWDNPGDTIWGANALQYRDSVGKRFWIAWQPWHCQWQHSSILRAPARADTQSACCTDTNGSPIGWVEPADTSGWLVTEFDTFPVIIREGQDLSRPELEVDSFWVKYPPVSYCADSFFVRIKNRDAERSTPEDCTTWVRLTWNGNVLDSMFRADTIGHGQSCTLSLHRNVPGWMRDSGLLAANVNPEMRYVEKEGTDDNTAYLRLFVPYELIGTIDGITPPGGKTDPPLLPMRLTSISWEDSTGQTPADSARVLFAWYGQRDSVVHATDTTAWFAFCADTVLEFPHGCGKYTLQTQFRDSGAVESQFFGDSTDSIIVFDSVPPAGSIAVEGGRFASNSTRTLHLSASDSAAGVAMMRFMNRGRVNLVRNGGFTAAEGQWSFTNGSFDTSLSMGRLSVGPTQAAVRQFVAPESISAYAGDSCVLEASILAHVHDGEATGEVSFWHFSVSENPEITDTLWELADSASYSGDLLSLTGRYNLSTRFLIAAPAPESGWVWQGGMVRVRAQGVDGGTGTVWCDDVGLNAYEPQAGGYAWWGQYDTVAQWDIGSSAGQHVVGMCVMDSAGAENPVPYADTVIFDPTPPVVDISLPMFGQLVNGSSVEVTGWAYDPIEIAGDTWFSRRTLTFRHADSTNWLPVSPDSSSLSPAYPDSMASQGPAVHLGYWNTLGLEDGSYYLMLSAIDSAENLSSCTTWVMVDQGFGGGDVCGGPEGGGSGLGEGSVYVGSASGTVLHLSDDLDSLDAFSVSDSGSQANVTAIVELGEDSILALDAANKRVHKLHRSGEHRRRLVSGLSEPVDLKQDANGNFWLVDKGWNRIGKFRSSGTLVFVRGGLGADSLHFRSPEGIAVKGGLVYVADAGNNRVAVWDTSGHFKTTITGDFENPTSVFVTDNGAIYLTDGSDGKLKGITPLGGNIVTIGTADSSKLKGLVPSENRHSLFSLASEPNKVYKLRIQSDESGPGGAQSGGRVNLPKTLSLNQPFPNPARARLNIAYALPRQTRVELKLYDVAGKLVTTLANGEQKPGYYNVTWNRQDTKGRSCACGVYFCTLSAENKRFSRKVILTE